MVTGGLVGLLRGVRRTRAGRTFVDLLSPIKRWQYRVDVCGPEGWFVQFFDSRARAAAHIVWHRRLLGRPTRVNGEFWA